jgi:hypothetical protein
MNYKHDQFDFPLQSELPPDLERIDESLADLAKRDQAPPGLTDRIYEASVSALPRLRLRGRAAAGPQRMRFHRPVWGQLAMAASIGLAFVLVAWFLSMPTGAPDRNDLIAERTDAPVVRTVARHSVRLTPEAEWLLLETGFNGERISYLVETRDITFADLRSESERLFDELEL